jgi:hypothetical protein
LPEFGLDIIPVIVQRGLRPLSEPKANALLVHPPHPSSQILVRWVQVGLGRRDRLVP